VRDVKRLAQIHRAPFDPILPVLEADSPLGEYRKIADEILLRLPDATKQPLEAAEAIRAYLLLRLGMHLGVRQRNLRELLFCLKGQKWRSERYLQQMRCGELRWNEKKQGWEVFIPYQAFKNHYSSFFERKPFSLLLPDTGRFHSLIESYLDRHRAVLLAGRLDPSTFFIRSYKRMKRKKDVVYHGPSMNDAWKVAVQRYGIYNPYTGLGAIEGLRAHGPHTVRDVLATHIVKLTGSYELASYAIQSTPEMVAKHYGRFLPHDKTAQAARILNQVWERS
jgi:hypothetical protein